MKTETKQAAGKSVDYDSIKIGEQNEKEKAQKTLDHSIRSDIPGQRRIFGRKEFVA